MDPVEVARLQAVEDAVAALLQRKGAITRTAVASALATSPPPLPASTDPISSRVEETV